MHNYCGVNPILIIDFWAKNGCISWGLRPRFGTEAGLCWEDGLKPGPKTPGSGLHWLFWEGFWARKWGTVGNGMGACIWEGGPMKPVCGLCRRLFAGQPCRVRVARTVSMGVDCNGLVLLGGLAGKPLSRVGPGGRC